MITMHACPRRTDRQTDEHHGNSSTILSNEGIAGLRSSKVGYAIRVH